MKLYKEWNGHVILKMKTAIKNLNLQFNDCLIETMKIYNSILLVKIVDQGRQLPGIVQAKFLKQVSSMRTDSQ